MNTEDDLKRYGSVEERLGRPAAWVLAMLRSASRPMKAYDFLAQRHRDGFTCHPPTVYRALADLEAEGLVHRVEPLKAYIACREAHRGEVRLAIIICDACGSAQEVCAPGLGGLSAAAASRGFVLERVVFEGRGLCRDCQFLR